MDEKQKLWEEYRRKKTSELREKIIIEYAGLVKIIAGKLCIYLGHNVEYDDLLSFGTFGLIDAVDKFDSTMGVKFETYASLRVRGAMIDQVRKMDWIPRTLRQKQKKLDVAYQKLEEKYGRSATEEEIADELQISMEDLETWQNQTNISVLVSLDQWIEQGGVKIDYNEQEENKRPERVVEREELKKILLNALDLLTVKEKRVILLYYYEDLTLKEISVILEVSESRISQLHTKALQKLRVKLGSNISIFMGI